MARLNRWLPGLAIFRAYDPSWLRHDIVAGLVVTTMLVPVGIAYAEASGIPGINGLYATIVPLLAYALVGPSRIIVLGPDSALAPLILAVVAPLAGGDAHRAVALGSAMAIVAGLVSLAAGLARLGFITELLSKPIRYGYMNGIALTVILSQVPKLLGFSAAGGGLLSKAPGVVRAIIENRLHPATCAVGLGALAVILILKRWRSVPAHLVAVVGATIAVAAFDLSSSGVQVLGELPRGLPMPRLPIISMSDVAPIVMAGLTTALVAFADTSVLSRTYAAKLKRPVDPNQEMAALGIANLAAAFFQGFPVSSSSSRTPVAEAAGARTQLTGVVGAVAVSVLLLAAPSLLRNLPQAALAAVVIASALGLFEIADLRRIYRVQRWEFWLSIGCFAGVVVFGAIPGIGLAILAAVIEFLWDGWRPHWAVLGRPPNLRGYHDITRHPDARQIPGLVLFRWDAPLFFANAELFNQCVLEAVKRSPAPVQWVVVAAEPVTSVDVTAADALADLDQTLHDAGIELCFAEMKDPVTDKLKRFGLFTSLGEKAFFPTVGAAVRAYLTSHDVPWSDPDER
jgi:high affinity sulfate transporter 1